VDVKAGYLLTSTTMPLPSPLLDALLTIFRDLDIIDVVRIGTVSPLAVTADLEFSAHPQSLALITPDLQRTPCGHTRPSRLGWPARKVASERSGAQVRDASAHFPLCTRGENLRHRLGQVAHPLGQVARPQRQAVTPPLGQHFRRNWLRCG
jgi:hypothetical protein